MEPEKIIEQLNFALDEFDCIQPRLGRANTPVSELQRVYSLLASAMDRLSPPGSFHQARFREYNGTPLARRISATAGMLQALKTEYEKGYLQTVQEIIHGNTFASFLDMAIYLRDQGYKDAAAVIAGSVLEQHLRELCNKNGIPTIDNGRPRKAETLNQELHKNDIYNLLEQKQVTTWLDLRNNAAHGKYDQYGAQQVQHLIIGIRDFMIRYPA